MMNESSTPQRRPLTASLSEQSGDKKNQASFNSGDRQDSTDNSDDDIDIDIDDRKIKPTKDRPNKFQELLLELQRRSP